MLRSKPYAILVALLVFLAGASIKAAGGHALRLYVTNSRGDDITVIDLATMKVTGDIKVGKEPHGLAASADGRHLFITLESEDTVKEIDSATGKVTHTLKLSGRPNECAVTPDGKFLAVPIRTGGVVDIINVPEFKIVKALPLSVPHNCFNTGDNERVFCSSMGGKEISVIDLKAMRYAGSIPVGGIPRPFAVTKNEKLAFVQLSDLHGFVVADVPARHVIRTVTLPPTTGENLIEPHTPSHGMALSPDGQELWVADSLDSAVYVYDLSTHKLIKKVEVGKTPLWLTFSPNGKYCCVSNAASDNCSIIDAKSYREIARVKTGKTPKRLLVVSIPLESASR